VDTEHETVRHRAKHELRLVLQDGRTRSPFRWEFFDPYYWLMEAPWPVFFGTVVLVFVALNLLFGILYASIPGSLANAERGSLADGFFFSVDTLATVGYGNLYPASRIGHAIAAVEILLGLFFAATVTGLIFARFSRPRRGLLFSKYAVIGRYQGQRALMVRAAWARTFPLIDATAQLSWLESAVTIDGKRFRRLRELELVRSHNPMVALGWTLIHLLPDDSDLLATLAGGERVMLTANISGTDMLLASPSLTLQRYLRAEIRVDYEFVEMISEDEKGLCLNLTHLHEVQPIAEGGDRVTLGPQLR
jgi:inward rectifier potassium channel